MLSCKERDSKTRTEVLQGAGLEHQPILLLLKLRSCVSYLFLYNNYILAFERIVCKAPADYKPSEPGTFPEDVPLSIAFTSEENDPWTETSHKFRFYEQPIIVKCDPCEVDVGTIREVYVWADENSQFFEPVPSVSRSGVDEEAEERGLITLASSLGGITCQFGRFGET